MTEQTEPQAGPVVKVARDLTEIERLTTRLRAQAVAKARDRIMPGGHAMVSLGDVGSRRAQEAYIEELEARWWNDPDTTHKDRPDVSHLSAEDEEWEPPLQTLLWWSEERRERYGYPLDGRRPTIQTEVAFLRWALDAMWRDEPQWQDFADDVNLARRRIEDVLHAGMRQDRTRVPCNRPTCEKKPRLVRIHGETEEEDRYKCTACKHWFDQDEYERAYADQLRSKGAERFVSIREAIATLAAQGRSENTVRKWLASDEDDAPMTAWEAHTWRRMVWWPDVWRKHLTTATRKRDVA